MKKQSRNLLISDGWKDYELLNCQDGMRLEQWGDFVLLRPDSNVPSFDQPKFEKYDASYHIDSKKWEFKKQFPEFWVIRYRNLTFKIRLTNSRQVGLFPEQAVNWDWISDKIKNSKREIKVLNLFGYTGGATISAAQGDALICHVDSSKSAVEWCKENACLSGLKNYPIRYIVDDCVRFVEREIKREKIYDAIIMDPPSYGHGKDGKIWKLEKNLLDLLIKCQKILSEKPLFFLITAHTTSLSENVLIDMLKEIMKSYKGTVYGGKLGIPIKEAKKNLLCGIYARWEAISS